jgi:hypothetical protein
VVVVESGEEGTEIGSQRSKYGEYPNLEPSLIGQEGSAST